MSWEAAGALVSALETILRISDEEAVSLAQARDKASRTSALFEERLKAKIADSRQATTVPANGFATSARDEMARFENQFARSALRESSFVSAFHALMHLYADEATRPTVEIVFDLLRQIRMISFQEGPIPGPDHPVFRLPTMADDEHTKSESLLEHHEAMRSYMDRRQTKVDLQIEKSHALLAEALKLARCIQQTD